MVKTSFARLSTFGRGVAYGLWLAGMSVGQIVGKVEKTDGTRPTKQTVRTTVADLKDDPPWGQDVPARHGGGAPRTTTPALDHKIRNLIFKV